MSISLQRNVAVLVLGLFCATGCESMSSGKSREAATPQQAIIITGAHGGGTAVFFKSADPERPTVMTSGSMPMCETCKKDAIASFKTGAPLTSTCSDCGATRTKVAMVNPPVLGHQH